MPFNPQGIVAQWLLSSYGGLYTLDTDTIAVGTSAIELVNNDPERVHIIMCNLSVNNIVVSPNPDVTISEGIFISPQGGLISFNLRDDLIMPSIGWSAIASGASSDLYLATVRRYSPGEGGTTDAE